MPNFLDYMDQGGMLDEYYGDAGPRRKYAPRIGGAARATRPLSAYNKFAKKLLNSPALRGYSQQDKMRLVGAEWRKLGNKPKSRASGSKRSGSRGSASGGRLKGQKNNCIPLRSVKRVIGKPIKKNGKYEFICNDKPLNINKQLDRLFQLDSKRKSPAKSKSKPKSKAKRNANVGPGAQELIQSYFDRQHQKKTLARNRLGLN
jgi:hypothetical protein